VDEFAPALVAACLVDPVMTEDEARELWNSDFWSAGELDQLFSTASQLCLEGMNVPFNESV
jgi:lysozyme family protein